MSQAQERAERFPIRSSDGIIWEVLVDAKVGWTRCDSKDDAEGIAAAPALTRQCMTRSKCDVALGELLEGTAALFAKYGLRCYASRMFRRRAAQIRRSATARRRCNR